MDFDEIKSKFNLYDVATQMLGLSLKQVSANEYRGVSPAPGTHNTDNAFSITGDLWHDFSSGIGGKVLELVMYVKYGVTDWKDKKTLCEAAKFLAGDSYDSGYWTKYAEQREKFLTDIDNGHQRLLGDSELAIQTRDYLHSRRITDETIERFKLGIDYLYNGENGKEWRLVCPYLDMSGNPVYSASRQLAWVTQNTKGNGSKYVKAKKNVFLKNTLFGLNTIPRKDDECDVLFVGEGLFDGLSIAQEGYPILFFIGQPSKEHEDEAVKIARRFRRVITVFDCDSTSHAGQNFTVQLGKKFLAERLNFSCVESYGEGLKDVSDYYTAGGKIEELISRAINGYLFMSRYTFWAKSAQNLKKLSEYYPFANLSANEQATSLHEVKRFVHELTNIQLGESGRSEILEELKTYYPPERISEYANGMTRHELLSIWRDEFLADRHIFFNGSKKGGSYYEYQPAGYWARMTDADIESEISAFFRHEKDNKTIAQLTTQVRLMNTPFVMPKFNRKKLWLFGNGVFDLDTGELREPKPEDYLSWQVSYDYNEDAKCPMFDKFMAECADNEPSRIALLEDLLGYILYEENRLDKIFILIGDGNNGKTTFCKVLENLVKSTNERDDSKSVISVEPSMFDKGTEVIRLEKAVLNIAYDIAYDLRGCEHILKKVSSRDSLTGNFKFHDSYDFETRCKLIMTSNRMIRVNDDSFGMRRRLMFCRFANDFTGRDDTHLEKKLESELQGIFNKMYRAYKALLEREKKLGNRAIRPCIDQNEFIKEFTEIASPVAVFWAERKDDYIGKEIKKSEIFDDFKAYCERNSRFAGTENMFHKSLKKVAADDGVTISDIRHREGDSQPYYSQFSSQSSNQSDIQALEQSIDSGTLEIDE